MCIRDSLKGRQKTELERRVLLKKRGRYFFRGVSAEAGDFLGLQDVYKRQAAARVTGTNRDNTAARTPQRRAAQKIYPNDPCPCGSGKKYKQCHGRKPLAQ